MEIVMAAVLLLILWAGSTSGNSVLAGISHLLAWAAVILLLLVLLGGGVPVA